MCAKCRTSQEIEHGTQDNNNNNNNDSKSNSNNNDDDDDDNNNDEDKVSKRIGINVYTEENVNS